MLGIYRQSHSPNKFHANQAQETSRNRLVLMLIWSANKDMNFRPQTPHDGLSRHSAPVFRIFFATYGSMIKENSGI
jgi:hypothetical protein